MYFPSRKLILTTGLLALTTLAGCSTSRVRLHCPSCVRSWAEHAEPVPDTEYDAPRESTAPVPPDVPSADAPAANIDSPGPSLPEKPISSPRALPQATSEVPNFEEFDESSPGDSVHFNDRAPAELPPAPSRDASGAVEAEIPEGLQSDAANPMLLQRVRGTIPQIEVRDVPDSRRTATQAPRSTAGTPIVTTPTPDPIGAQPRRRPQPRHQTLSPTILQYDHNYPYSSIPSGEMKILPAQPSDSRTSAEGSDFDADRPDEFEFEFATPTSAVVSPEPWPYRQVSHE